MTTYENPRDAHGNRLCEYCGDPVPESLGTKPKRYCKRSCRQRAYEARKQRETIVAAVAAAVVRDRRTSRDNPTRAATTSRDVPKPQVTAEAAARPVPPLPPKPSRRRRGMIASPMPLLPFEEDADGE